MGRHYDHGPMPGRLLSRVARVATLAAPDDGRPTQIGIVAPGTADGAAVVDAVVGRLRSHEVPVVRLSGRPSSGAARVATRATRDRSRPGIGP